MTDSDYMKTSVAGRLPVARSSPVAPGLPVDCKQSVDMVAPTSLVCTTLLYVFALFKLPLLCSHQNDGEKQSAPGTGCKIFTKG